MKVILPKKIMNVRVCEIEGEIDDITETKRAQFTETAYNGRDRETEKTRNIFDIKNNPFRTAYITYQITTKQIDSSRFFLYSICSGCATEP